MAQAPTLIFDMDGVLVDSELIANTVFAEHLGRYGLSLTAEQTMARFRGRRLDTCVKMIAEEDGIRLKNPILDGLVIVQADDPDAARQRLNSPEAAADVLSLLHAYPASQVAPGAVEGRLEEPPSLEGLVELVEAARALARRLAR